MTELGSGSTTCWACRAGKVYDTGVPRPQSVPGGRPHVVNVRLSEAEKQDMDQRRGPLTPSEWVRYLMVRAKREDWRFDPMTPEK